MNNSPEDKNINDKMENNKENKGNKSPIGYSRKKIVELNMNEIMPGTNMTVGELMAKMI